ADRGVVGHHRERAQDRFRFTTYEKLYKFTFDHCFCQQTDDDRFTSSAYPIAVPVGQLGVFRDRLTSKPVHLDMVNRRIVDVGDVLVAESAAQILLIELLFQSAREATRLFLRLLDYRVDDRSPLVEAHSNRLPRTRQQLD